MGKNLKGRDIGKGLSQRKDGRYSARFVTNKGQRKEKYFDTLTEARSWLKASREEDEAEELPPFDVIADRFAEIEDKNSELLDLTVDKWYDYWMNNIISHLSWNTRRNYQERYEINVKPVIGKMLIRNVKPMHCQKVLQEMYDDYAGSTIIQTFITMGTMFKSALVNDIIEKHPMDGVKTVKRKRDGSDIKFLTIEEQERFLEAAKKSHNYYQYVLVLETGLRTGELIGLTWDSVDFENKTINVNKTMEYRYGRGYWVAGSPKTVSSYRTIPLTNRALQVLEQVYKVKETRKRSEQLNQNLEFVDRRNGEKRTLDMRDLVFINYRTGMPMKNSAYDSHMFRICDAAGIKRVSMHALRHTFATRAIERGMNPKSLQKILGHATISTTMDTYVHVTNDSMRLAMSQFEENQKDSSL